MKYISSIRTSISSRLGSISDFFVGDYDVLFWIRGGIYNFLGSIFMLTLSLLFLPFVYLLGYYQDMMNGVIWGEKQPPPHGRFQSRVWSGTWILVASLLYLLLWTTIPTIISIFYPRLGMITLVVSICGMLFFFPAVWILFNHDEKFGHHEAITIRRLLWNRTYLSQFPRIILMGVFGFLLSASMMIILATISVVTPITIQQLRLFVIVLSFPISYIATTQILYGFSKAIRNTLVSRRGSYYQNDSQPEWMNDDS